MRNTIEKRVPRHSLNSGKGFTLTELSVLMMVGAILASVLVADLSQTRMKLLQQACAANMKHWGMAIGMYMDDYNGVIFYDVGGLHFSDNNSPLQRYFGNGSNSFATLQMVRACPARVGIAPFGPQKGYEIPVGQFRHGLVYKDADIAGSPYFRGGNYWPDLKSVPVPAQYLLMTECYNTVLCNSLLVRVSSPASGFNSDPLPPLARHNNAVNCLFGDFHVELVSSNKIAQQDIGCGTTGNPWFNLD
ncbi:MAG TPA: prepilin-type N-terminal cleavage/methylation domain-containing protein [Verrucomicrobiae bacterium]|nr:prepilin-type N-terminal cleavage/methylation domain-containing protein [Verrucomicrobiae bacterium]